MRSLSKVALVALLALGLSAASRAQDPINPVLPVQGTREVALRGNLSFEPSDAYFINASYGPFLDPRLQVGVSLGYTKGNGRSTEYGVFGNYHFPGASTTLPFVGVFLGGTNAKSEGRTSNTTSYGVQGGVKAFLNPSVALTGALVYRDFSKGDLDNTLGLEFGLAVYLR